MDGGLLWIFLFIALAIGWLLGFHTRSSVKSSSEAPYSPPSPNMKHRLQLLFDSYTDESLDQFIHSLEVTPDTLAIHISIGKHFRTEGEVEKAILIHQNLIAHPELSEQASEPVLYELAKDYRAAGLFDRAESLLLQLKDSKAYGNKSCQLLLDIYEREKDWQDALEIACSMDKRRGSRFALRAAHYCCEMADLEIAQGDLLEGRRHLKKALSLSKSCVRAYLMSAELEFDQGDYRRAIHYLKQIAEMAPEYIPLVLPLMLKCTIETDSFEPHQQYLGELYHQTGQVSVLLAKADSMTAEGNADRARDLLEQEVLEHPSLSGMEALTRHSESSVSSDEGVLNVALRLLARINQEKPAYQCVQCGFKGETLHWLCPSCKSWQTVKPVVEYLDDSTKLMG